MTEDDRDRGVFERDAVDRSQGISDTRVYEGDLEARPPGVAQPDTSEAERLHFLEDAELRAGETDDPNEAAEEGLAYVPPVDPPVVGSEADGDPRLGAGFATSADDESHDAGRPGDPLPGEDEVTARVREALLAHSGTSSFADVLGIDTAGGIVRITGSVADLVDEDLILEVVSEVDGVVDVDNLLEVTAAR